MKLGILGAGSIARKMAATVRGMEGAELFAIASRDPERARAFAEEEGAERAYGSYEELVNDPAVELVYIATPHSRHCEDALLCIAAGKPVLCEKAFTMNAAEAERVLFAAKEQGVFVAEAIWTRYMPSRKIIDDLLASGIIGTPKVLTANLSYPIDTVRRLIDPELCGGALLDVGIYGLTFAAMHFGTDIERMESSVAMTDTGVDASESITLHYADGRMAVLNHSMRCRSDRMGIVHGTEGYLVVDNINDPLSVSVYDAADTLIKRVEMPPQITGYEYEVAECAECLRKGLTEPPSMPHAETIAMMRRMDALRAQWGLVYPKERR
ncbi:MAG: Gfo/Idh/MocA family oxidoreductase [Clostridia bacterium]|nr:Gfo/Idh/MocA family oxidoreductase [Clostridia bacterium]